MRGLDRGSGKTHHPASPKFANRTDPKGFSASPKGYSETFRVFIMFALRGKVTTELHLDDSRRIALQKQVF
jgi:hypothetical protein